MLSRGRRSVAAVAIVIAALIFTGIRPAQAQEQAPDLQMLLNLDLFSSSGGDHSQTPAPGGSMLDQIRALRQMGYLRSTSQDGVNPPKSAPAGGPSVPWIPDPFEENR